MREVALYTLKVSPKGWVFIPKELRDKHEISPGSEVQVVELGNVLVLIPVPPDPVAALRGMLKDGPSLTADLLEERARERSLESPGYA